MRLHPAQCFAIAPYAARQPPVVCAGARYRPTRFPRGRERGFTYLLVLFMVALLGVGLASVGQVWQTAAKREKEEELLFIGDEFRRAIASFYKLAPGGQVARYPRSLDELVQDRRFPAPVHHLRRIYRDPITGSTDWGLVKTPDGGIQGVHSRSTAMPLKTGGFRDIDEEFAGKLTYDEWVFTPLGSLAGAPPGPSRTSSPPGVSDGGASAP